MVSEHLFDVLMWSLGFETPRSWQKSLMPVQPLWNDYFETNGSWQMEEFRMKEQIIVQKLIKAVHDVGRTPALPIKLGIVRSIESEFLPYSLSWKFCVILCGWLNQFPQPFILLIAWIRIIMFVSKHEIRVIKLGGKSSISNFNNGSLDFDHRRQLQLTK